MPLRAAGNATRRICALRVIPSAAAPRNQASGTDANAAADANAMVGRIMSASTMIPAVTAISAIG